MGRKVERTRAGGRWTEARFWGFLRSSLRRASVRWPPKADAMRAARRAYTGENRRRKWRYVCGKCGGEDFKGDEVAAHHKIDCGTLRAFSDLPGFVERLLCEEEGFVVLCKSCHNQMHGKKG